MFDHHNAPYGRGSINISLLSTHSSLLIPPNKSTRTVPS